jgi:membrane protein insertase Oxa1/YidC/SpoIIIJ
VKYQQKKKVLPIYTGLSTFGNKSETKMNSESTISNTKEWLLFIISAIVFVSMLIWLPQWFWLALPFVCTFLVKALRVM